MTHPFVVAIPSYRRPEVCNSRTLAMLAREGVDPSAVWVFVADAAEARRYAAVLERGRYAGIVVGRPGVVAQRWFIHQHWPAGTRILSVDDDVRAVDRTVAAGPLFRDCRSLTAFVRRAFAVCRARGAYVWGVYPTANRRWQAAQPECSAGTLLFLVGTFYGYVSRPAARGALYTAVTERAAGGEKEDVELSLRYFLLDGTVVRYNRVAVRSTAYRPGGLGPLAGRRAAAHRAVRALARAFPGYGRPWFRRPAGVWEFRLDRRVEPPKKKTRPRREDGGGRC